MAAAHYYNVWASTTPAFERANCRQGRPRCAAPAVRFAARRRCAAPCCFAGGPAPPCGPVAIATHTMAPPPLSVLPNARHRRPHCKNYTHRQARHTPSVPPTTSCTTHRRSGTKRVVVIVKCAPTSGNQGAGRTRARARAKLRQRRFY